ncbi:MAG: hypothetical protein ABIK36_08105 [Pseudomonadota bacterium]
MSWQMIVLVGQLALGGGLVVYGARQVAHYWLATRDKGHAEQLERAMGKAQPGRKIAAGIVMALAGGLMLATSEWMTEALLGK